MRGATTAADGYLVRGVEGLQASRGYRGDSSRAPTAKKKNRVAARATVAAIGGMVLRGGRWVVRHGWHGHGGHGDARRGGSVPDGGCGAGRRRGLTDWTPDPTAAAPRHAPPRHADRAGRGRGGGSRAGNTLHAFRVRECELGLCPRGALARTRLASSAHRTISHRRSRHAAWPFSRAVGSEIGSPFSSSRGESPRNVRQENGDMSTTVEAVERIKYFPPKWHSGPQIGIEHGASTNKYH